MARRSAVPLFKSRHAAFIRGIEEADDNDKAMASHLSVGTGARAYTITHTHKSWFVYNQEGALYYRIPKSDPCYKYGDMSPCGGCKLYDHDEYQPKTPAGEGRRILISNEWTNPATGEKEYFGLRDRVESYFALDGPRAPDGVEYGNDMIDGDGISVKTLNRWVRSIGGVSSISADLRRDRLREEIDVEEVDVDDPKKRDMEQIKDFGTDRDGNEIPDLMNHDMRATFCTQLMRNNVSRTKAIEKTGHKDPDSMSTYVKFAEKEIDSEEESSFY